MKKMIGHLTAKAFEQLQNNTVEIYLAEANGDVEKAVRLKKWRIKFCENPANFINNEGALQPGTAKLAHKYAADIRTNILDEYSQMNDLQIQGYILDAIETSIYSYFEDIPVTFENYPQEEQIDTFISIISSHEKDTEILLILSIFTAYNIKEELYTKYFDELGTDEVIQRLQDYLKNNGCGIDEEDIAWHVVIETLGTNKVWDIIDNIDQYMDLYNGVVHPLEKIKFDGLKDLATYKCQIANKRG